MNSSKHPLSPIDNTNIIVEGKYFDTNRLRSMKLPNEEKIDVSYRTISNSAKSKNHRRTSSFDFEPISSDTEHHQRRVKSDIGRQFLPLSNDDRVRKKTRSFGTNKVKIQTQVTKMDRLGILLKAKNNDTIK